MVTILQQDGNVKGKGICFLSFNQFASEAMYMYTRKYFLGLKLDDG